MMPTCVLRCEIVLGSNVIRRWWSGTSSRDVVGTVQPSDWWTTLIRVTLCVHCIVSWRSWHDVRRIADRQLVSRTGGSQTRPMTYNTEVLSWTFRKSDKLIKQNWFNTECRLVEFKLTVRPTWCWFQTRAS